jgi:hypothetical protein
MSYLMILTLMSLCSLPVLRAMALVERVKGSAK